VPDPARRGGGSNLYPQARVPWARDWPELSPVTIVRLERWVAFPMQPEDLPTNYVAPDFLDTYAGPHGTGDTPDAAYLDLARQLSPERHRAR
jgi:hypothetical protein